MSDMPKEIMATAMRCLMAPEHEHVGNIAAALLAERKANEAKRDRLREELVKAGELLDADLVARAVAAEDERDRLREALKIARAGFSTMVDSGAPLSRTWAYGMCREIDAALAKEAGQ